MFMAHQLDGLVLVPNCDKKMCIRDRLVTAPVRFCQLPAALPK